VSLHVDGYDNFVEIGRGGLSTVYSATQLALHRPVAVKVVDLDPDDATARRRFQRECAALGVLGESPGIVPVYSATFTADGRGCIVMRLMRESLADTLRREGPLDVERVIDVGVTALTALDHAHRRGIVHRDVKPANLLVAEGGEIALGDFDISSVDSVRSSTATLDSMSPPHAPPERWRGDAAAGPSGDIWSLGSTLYMLLTGSQPFGTASAQGGVAGLIDRVMNDPTPPVGRPDVAPAIESVIGRALAKDPDDRWPDAASMRGALLQASGRTSAPSGHDTATPERSLERAASRVGPSSADRSSRRREVISAIAVVVAVVIALAVAVLIAFG